MLTETLDAGLISNILFGIPFDIAYLDSIKHDGLARMPRIERQLVSCNAASFTRLPMPIKRWPADI
jgi:hypothetical protein